MALRVQARKNCLHGETASQLTSPSHSPFPFPGADLKSKPDEIPGVQASISVSWETQTPTLLFPVLLPQRKDLLTNYITWAPWLQHYTRETDRRCGVRGRGDGWKYSQNTSSLFSLPQTGPLGRGFISPGFQLLSWLPAPCFNSFSLCLSCLQGSISFLLLLFRGLPHCHTIPLSFQLFQHLTFSSSNTSVTGFLY